MANPTYAAQIAWEFRLQPPIDDVADFHAEGERLMAELLVLEECNPGVADPAVSTEYERGVIVVELEAQGDGLLSTIQTALDVIRTAIHAIGGGTPNWPTAYDLDRRTGAVGREVDFVAGAMTTTPIAVTASA